MIYLCDLDPENNIENYPDLLCLSEYCSRVGNTTVGPTRNALSLRNINSCDIIKIATPTASFLDYSSAGSSYLSST